MAPKGLISLTALVLLAACAAPEQPRYGPPPDGRSGPKSAQTEACWSDANRRAEQDYLRDTDNPADRGFSQPGYVQNELARRDAKRYRQRLYEECLRRSGISPEKH